MGGITFSLAVLLRSSLSPDRLIQKWHLPLAQLGSQEIQKWNLQKPESCPKSGRRDNHQKPSLDNLKNETNSIRSKQKAIDVFLFILSKHIFKFQ